MKDGLFLIGEAAEICGLSSKALRFYERAGLVAPCRVDPATKYRYYSSDQLTRLDLIRAARSLGLGIGEIKALLGAREGAELVGLIEGHERRAEARIEELARALASMKAVRSALADSLSPAGARGVFAKDLPERSVLARKIGADPSLEEVARASAALEGEVRRRGLVNRFETGILFAADGGAELHPSAAFVAVEAAEGSDRSGLSRLPAGRYLCVRYDEGSAASRQRALREYLRRRRLEPRLVLQADLIGASFPLGGDKAELQVLARPSSPPR